MEKASYYLKEPPTGDQHDKAPQRPMARRHLLPDSRRLDGWRHRAAGAADIRGNHRLGLRGRSSSAPRRMDFKTACRTRGNAKGVERDSFSLRREELLVRIPFVQGHGEADPGRLGREEDGLPNITVPGSAHGTHDRILRPEA